MAGDEATAGDGGQAATDEQVPAATVEAVEAQAAPGGEEEPPDPSTDGRPPLGTVAEAFAQADEDLVAFKPEEVVS